MKRVLIRDNRGETIVEVMASIVIGALSVTLLFGSIMATSTLDRTAENIDQAHYGALSEAEEQKIAVSAPPGAAASSRVEISGSSHTADIYIDIYGGEGMYSYKEKRP